MHATLIVLFGLAIIAHAFTPMPKRVKPAWSLHLKGWQKLFGVIAVVMALLIVLNPEFLALGILGDTAFFDMLVLALSLQMHQFVIRAWRWCVGVLAKGLRWAGIPSPGLCYVVAVSTVAIGSAVSVVQRAVHRIFS